MRRNGRRAAVPAPAQNRLDLKTFPAPVRGWVVNENLAASKPAAARQLDNFFPTTTGIRLRGGCTKWATISTGAVLSMWSYVTPSTEEFFAADEENIFEVTTVADPDVIPSAAVSGQTAGYYSVAQIVNAGGYYQYIVNGADDPLLYDGATFTPIDAVSTPAITGVTTSGFAFVFVFKSRLFFLNKTMTAYYLGVDAIGGAASSLSLNGVFSKGGHILMGGTWSSDAGDGIDDYCVFISTKGEVAVYSGTDPSSSSTWALVGVYNATEPLGQNAMFKAGGDLLVATEAGIVALSEALNKDVTDLTLAAVTKAIEPEWRREVSSRRSLPWELLKWSANNMLVVSQPRVSDSTDAQCLVANLETGSWCRFTGWDVRCVGLFNGRGYFGANDGCVYLMEASGGDDGEPYTGVYVGQFDHFNSAGLTKTVRQARATYLTAADFNAKLSASANYSISLPSAPNSVADYSVDEWDVGKWDEMLWDAGTSYYTTTSRWVSIGKTGYAIAPQLQITSGMTPLPRIELVAIDMTYERGAVVV